MRTHVRKLHEGLYLRTKNHEMIPLDTRLFAKKLTDFLETSRMKEGLFQIPILEYVKAPAFLRASRNRVFGNWSTGTASNSCIERQ